MPQYFMTYHCTSPTYVW